MVWLRSALFTVVFPGIVVVLVPSLLMSRKPIAIELGAGRYAGVPLIAIGVLAYLRCAWDFAAVGRGTPAPWDPPRRLIMVGLYRYVRNPIFLALLLVVLGEALYLEGGILLFYAAFLFSAFHLRVTLFQEPALREQFGDAYEQYRARVPRWLPTRRPFEPPRSSS